MVKPGDIVQLEDSGGFSDQKVGLVEKKDGDRWLIAYAPAGGDWTSRTEKELNNLPAPEKIWTRQEVANLFQDWWWDSDVTKSFREEFNLVKGMRSKNDLEACNTMSENNAIILRKPDDNLLFRKPYHNMKLLRKPKCKGCYKVLGIEINKTHFDDIENVEVELYDGKEKVLKMELNKDEVENIYSIKCHEDMQNALKYKEHHAKNLKCLLHSIEDDVDSKLSALFLPLKIFAYIFKNIYENEAQIFWIEPNPMIDIQNIAYDQQLDIVNKVLLPLFEKHSISYNVNEIELEIKPRLTKMLIKHINNIYSKTKDDEHHILIDDLNEIMIYILQTLKEFDKEDIKVELKPYEEWSEEFRYSNLIIFPKDNIINKLAEIEDKDQIEKIINDISTLYAKNITTVITKIINKYKDPEENFNEDLFHVLTIILSHVYDKYNRLFLDSLELEDEEIDLPLGDMDKKKTILREKLQLLDIDDLEEDLEKISEEVLENFAINISSTKTGTYFNELPVYVQSMIKNEAITDGYTKAKEFMDIYYYSRLEILLQDENIKLANHFYYLYKTIPKSDVMKKAYKCMLDVFIASIVFDFETKNIKIDDKTYSFSDLLKENGLHEYTETNKVLLEKLFTHLITQNKKIHKALLHLDRNIHLNLKINNKTIEQVYESDDGLKSNNYLVRTCKHCDLF